ARARRQVPPTQRRRDDLPRRARGLHPGRRLVRRLPLVRGPHPIPPRRGCRTMRELASAYLGLAVSNRSIRRYRGRGPARPSSPSWRTFLRAYAHSIWAADFVTVQTLAFRTLYVLFFITHARRELVHLAVTAHPTAAWVWRQLVEATAWSRRPKHLIRD